MNDIWILYALTRVDAVRNTIISVLVTSFIVGGLMTIFTLVWLSVEGPDGEKLPPPLSWFVARYKALIAGLAICAIAIVVVPSKNDILFIIGGAKLLEMARSDRAASIGSKTLDAVEQWITENTPNQDKTP